jgi:hypothetical protein
VPKPLQDYYMFPEYQTREIYDAQPGENADAQPWDGSKKLKGWIDLSPKNILSLGIGVGDIAVYEAAIEMADNGGYAVGLDGQPKVSKMGIPVEEAYSANFLPLKGIVPTLADLGGGKNAERMIKNSQSHQSIPLNLPPGSRVRFAPGLGNAAPVVYLAGEPVPEEQGAAAQANVAGQTLDIVKKILAKVSK